ncbi:hypothetical protein HED54_00870 [Ochrobactrum anthropi ATCC 49188]|nr:hypothetical protein [Brucella anthropi ATCC 49188]
MVIVGHIFALSASHSSLIMASASTRCLRRFGSGMSDPKPPPKGLPEPNQPFPAPLNQVATRTQMPDATSAQNENLFDLIETHFLL